MRYLKKVLIILLICVLVSVVVFHTQIPDKIHLWRHLNLPKNQAPIDKYKIDYSTIPLRRSQILVYSVNKENISKEERSVNQSVRDTGIDKNVSKEQDTSVQISDVKEVVNPSNNSKEPTQEQEIQRRYKPFDLKGYLKVTF